MGHFIRRGLPGKSGQGLPRGPDAPNGFGENVTGDRLIAQKKFQIFRTGAGMRGGKRLHHRFQEIRRGNMKTTMYHGWTRINADKTKGNIEHTKRPVLSLAKALYEIQPDFDAIGFLGFMWRRIAPGRGFPGVSRIFQTEVASTRRRSAVPGRAAQSPPADDRRHLLQGRARSPGVGFVNSSAFLTSLASSGLAARV